MSLRSQRARLPLALLLLAIISLAAWQIARQIRATTARQNLETAFAERSFDRAQTLLEAQLQADPASPRLHLLAARLARRNYDLELADRELQKFLRNGGDPADAGFEQGLAELQVGATTHAAEFFRVCTATPQAPETGLIVEALVEGALLRRDEPALEKYLSYWERHFTSDADRAQAQLWRGRGLKLRRDLVGEKRAYERAVQLDSHNRQARLALVGRLLDEDPDAAGQHLALLQTASPDDLEVLFQAARLDRNLGRLADAQQKLDQILKQKPQHVEALVLRGRIALEEQNTSDAGRDLVAAEKISPQHPAVLQAMIDYLRISGQEDQAERYRERFASIRVKFESDSTTETQRREEQRGVGEERQIGPHAQ